MTTTTPAPNTTPSLEDAQRNAIEQSGWGIPFRFLQPRNLAFWLYVFGVGSGALAMFHYFGQRPGFYAPAIAGGALLFGLYLVPWLLLLRHHNRFTSQPAGLLAAGFVWGGVAATFWIAITANGALLDIWTKIGGPAFGSRWAAGLTAPINEEFGKALGLVLLLVLAPRLVRSAYDGFIIGAFIGLGFQVFEDILYAYNGAAQAFGANQAGAVERMFWIRGLSGIVSHALFSAIFCAGLMWVLTTVRGERRVARGLLTMAMAMTFHFTWDDMSGITAGNVYLLFPVLLVVAAIELVALFYVLRHAARTEQAWMRDLLAPEAETRVISPELLDAVSGLYRQRRAYGKGLHNRRAGRHQIEAAHDLAHEIALADGAGTAEVQHARDELTRLRQRASASTEQKG